MGFGTYLQVCLLLAELTSISLCHVLVAGNEDAFRSLAKNFVPQELADQLVNLVAQAKQVSEAPNGDGEEYYKEYANPNESQSAEREKEAEYQTEDRVLLRLSKAGPGQGSEPKPKQMAVNLDELVEKVRARLLDEIKSNASAALSPRGQPPEQDHNNNDRESYPPSQKPPHPRKRPRRPVSVKQPLKSTLSEKPGQLIESHDVYEKYKLSKKNKQKDSYEEYIMKAPKQDDDALVSEEQRQADSSNKNIRFVKKHRQEKQPTEPKSMIDNSNQNRRPEQYNEYSSKNSMSRKTTRRMKQGSNEDDRKRQQITSARSESPAVEYVDDDYHTTVITTEVAAKAATEFIGGGDWDDETPEGYQRPTEATLAYPLKKVPKKIATNMAHRLRYSMKTVNYYNKLPRIAEKYNFDEPIPEKDQEEEKFKPLFSPPTNINGNVKV